jgi:hypothetical protein
VQAQLVVQVAVDTPPANQSPKAIGEIRPHTSASHWRTGRCSLMLRQKQ